jgi:hypothetical protein
MSALLQTEGDSCSNLLLDNVIAAAFGNASAGPTAAKAFQHLAGDANAREKAIAEVAALGDRQLSMADLDRLPYTDAGGEASC